MKQKFEIQKDGQGRVLGMTVDAPDEDIRKRLSALEGKFGDFETEFVKVLKGATVLAQQVAALSKQFDERPAAPAPDGDHAGLVNLHRRQRRG